MQDKFRDFFSTLFGRSLPKADVVLAYEQAQRQQPIPKEQALERVPFFVFDTETTGLHPAEDYILSFGSVRLQQAAIRLEESLEFYLKSPKGVRESIEVHGLIQAVNPTPLHHFARAVLPQLSQTVLVGHHVSFDIAMLEKALRPFGLRRLVNPRIDTMYLAARLEEGPFFDVHTAKKGHYTLDAVCARYGVPTEDRHTAGGDALATARLLQQLLQLAKKKGIRTLGALIQG